MFRLWKECAVSRNSIYVLLVALLLPLMSVCCFATPLNNVFDTQPIYTVYGAERFFSEKDKGEIRFHISPFYQQTRTARDNNGKRVPAGDRRGQWNSFGMFFGSDAISPNTIAAYPRLNTAQTSVMATTKYDAANIVDQWYHSQINKAPDLGLTGEDAFSKPYPAPTTGTSPNLVVNRDNYFAYVSQPINYEKIGVRGQLSFDFGFGLGVIVKGGVVDVKQAPYVKQSPTSMIFNPTFISDYTVASGGTASQLNKDAQALATNFLNQPTLTQISQELGIDLSTYHKTCPEDIHLQIYWNFPVDCFDNEEEVGMTFIPNISAGVWFPTGKKSDINQPFSVPTGNDGFYGITAECSLGFDFPILPPGDQTLQVVALGGILVFNEKNEPVARVPSSDFQSGFIPWKTNIHRQPGLTWYMGGSLVAENFLDGLSIYTDFLYTQHVTDSIQLRETNAKRRAAFANGMPRFVRETAWKNQQVNVGFNYKLAEAIALGGAVQAHISGTRVYRSVTLLGGITVMF
jgi:hypothetical protein